MRYVDNTFLDLPEGWDDLAENAIRQLLAGERNIEQLAHVWRGVKSCLADASHTRCWYCESKIIRSDNAVDHYRPKGEVKTGILSNDGSRIDRLDIDPKHDGYKWAAFSISNFRFSCEHCNEYRKDLDGTSGGKWNYFPLIQEANRAYIIENERFENPVLLDPCNPLDWALLSYDSMGKPFSRFEKGCEDDLKVRFSIRLLHLDQSGLNEARRACWSLFSPILDQAKLLYLEMLKKTPGAEHNFKVELRRLAQWLNPKNSATYIGFIKYKLRNDKGRELHPWIEILLGDFE